MVHVQSDWQTTSRNLFSSGVGSGFLEVDSFFFCLLQGEVHGIQELRSNGRGVESTDEGITLKLFTPAYTNPDMSPGQKYRHHNSKV